MSEIVSQLAAGVLAGVCTGLVCWGAMQRDVRWLKESVAELRTLFFKYVQENNHRDFKGR